MRRAFGWVCYRIVMAWPLSHPDNRLFAWCLSWAGWYAMTDYPARKLSKIIGDD